MGIIVIFEEEAQPKQMGEARAAPGLTAPAQALLELFAQRLGRPAALRGPGFRHGLVVQVVAVILKVTHFAFEFALLGRRARGGRCEQLFQPAHDARLAAPTQGFEQRLHPGPRLGRGLAVEQVRHGPEVVRRRPQA